jgi:hypothetical protein
MGLRILESMLTSGFVLAPEVIRWNEFLLGGSPSPTVAILQKRISFTELAFEELPQHAQEFGHFAVEFEIEALRKLGALPVWYLPKAVLDNHDLEGVGAALVCRLAQVEGLLKRLLTVQEIAPAMLRNSKSIPYDINGNRTGVIRDGEAALDLVQYLTVGLLPLADLMKAVITVENLFYPADDLRNLDSPDLLHYYRQREWRIVSNFVSRGEETTRSLSREERETLMEIDASWFSEELEWPAGKRWPRERECVFYPSLGGRRVLDYARNLIVPQDALHTARALVAEYEYNLPISQMPSR